MASEAELLAAARIAATEWSADVAAVELLSMSENAVYRVDEGTGEKFVLRLHRVGYNTLPEMESEVTWVEALQAHGIATATPRRALSGVTHLPVDVGNEVRFAGAVEWVDGVPMEEALEADPTTLESAYRRVGANAAGIRQQSSGWSAPDRFVRRHWNAEGLVGLDPLWGRYWESDGADPTQQAVFAQAREYLFGVLNDLPTDPAHYGLIHADLHLNNVMVDGPTSTVIDFDDAGFGWYVHELAVALHPAWGEPWYEPARDALLAGYQEVHALSDFEIGLLDAFLLVRSLMIVGWLTARPELPAIIQLPAIVESAAKHARPFLA